MGHTVRVMALEPGHVSESYLVGVGGAERSLARSRHEALRLVEGGVGVAHGAVVEELKVVRVVRVHRVRPHHLLLVQVQRRYGPHRLWSEGPTNGTNMEI